MLTATIISPAEARTWLPFEAMYFWYSITLSPCAYHSSEKTRREGTEATEIAYGSAEARLYSESDCTRLKRC